jgi:hypothetical protein
MTTTEMTTAQASDAMRNGVATATLFATLDAVKQAPEAARFQFRARQARAAGVSAIALVAGGYMVISGLLRLN